MNDRMQGHTILRLLLLIMSVFLDGSPQIYKFDGAPEAYEADYLEDKPNEGVVAVGEEEEEAGHCEQGDEGIFDCFHFR